MRLWLPILLLAATQAPGELITTPKKSAEFAILLPNGGQILLSTYRGKVCLVEFLSTTCPHCQHESQLVSKLMPEFAHRGFQALGVAFNENAKSLVPAFIANFQVAYPVGYSPPEPVYSYLGASQTERLMVPQVVLIDRKGVIRLRTAAAGDNQIQDETFLRSEIEKLLREPVHTASRK